MKKTIISIFVLLFLISICAFSFSFTRRVYASSDREIIITANYNTQNVPPVCVEGSNYYNQRYYLQLYAKDVGSFDLVDPTESAKIIAYVNGEKKEIVFPNIVSPSNKQWEMLLTEDVVSAKENTINEIVIPSKTVVGSLGVTKYETHIVIWRGEKAVVGNGSLTNKVDYKIYVYNTLDNGQVFNVKNVTTNTNVPEQNYYSFYILGSINDIPGDPTNWALRSYPMNYYMPFYEDRGTLNYVYNGNVSVLNQLFLKKLTPESYYVCIQDIQYKMQLDSYLVFDGTFIDTQTGLLFAIENTTFHLENVNGSNVWIKKDIELTPYYNGEELSADLVDLLDGTPTSIFELKGKGDLIPTNSTCLYEFSGDAVIKDGKIFGKSGDYYTVDTLKISIVGTNGYKYTFRQKVKISTDITPPEIIIPDDFVYDYNEGDILDLSSIKAIDDKDGEVAVEFILPEGMMTDGKLNLGKWTVQAKAKDGAIHETVKSIIINIRDYAPPTIIVDVESAPYEGYGISESIIQNLFGIKIEDNSNQVASVFYDLSDVLSDTGVNYGKRSIKIVAQDYFGNTSEKELTIYLLKPAELKDDEMVFVANYNYGDTQVSTVNGVTYNDKNLSIGLTAITFDGFEEIKAVDSAFITMYVNGEKKYVNFPSKVSGGKWGLVLEEEDIDFSPNATNEIIIPLGLRIGNYGVTKYETHIVIKRYNTPNSGQMVNNNDFGVYVYSTLQDGNVYKLSGDAASTASGNDKSFNFVTNETTEVPFDAANWKLRSYLMNSYLNDYEPNNGFTYIYDGKSSVINNLFLKKHQPQYYYVCFKDINFIPSVGSCFIIDGTLIDSITGVLFRIMPTTFKLEDDNGWAKEQMDVSLKYDGYNVQSNEILVKDNEDLSKLVFTVNGDMVPHNVKYTITSSNPDCIKNNHLVIPSDMTFIRTTLTWSFVGLNGYTYNYHQRIRITRDFDVPEIELPDDLKYNYVEGDEFDFSSIKITDKYDGDIVPVIKYPYEMETYGKLNIGYWMIEIIGKDSSGNTSSTSFNIYVADITPPTVTVENNSVVIEANGIVPISKVLKSMGIVIVDNYDTEISDITFDVSSIEDGDKYIIGEYVIPLVVKDSSDNTTSVGINVFVKDTTKPVITFITKDYYTVGSNFEYYLDVSDDIDGNITTSAVVDDSNALVNGKLIEGIHSITIIATDSSNNQMTISRNIRVVVNDKKGPTINAPTSLTFKEGEELSYSAYAIDDEEGAIPLNVMLPLGMITDGLLNAGEWKITFKASDSFGNESILECTVTVEKLQTSKAGCGAVTSIIPMMLLICSVAIIKRKRK